MSHTVGCLYIIFLLCVGRFRLESSRESRVVYSIVGIGRASGYYRNRPLLCKQYRNPSSGSDKWSGVG